MRSRTRPSENTNKERAWGDEATMTGGHLTLGVILHSDTGSELLLFALLFQLAVERGVKNTENPFRVLLASDAGELRCWKG